MNKPENVDSYITTFAPQVQELLRQVRKTVLDNAPEAEETISYGMPTFKLHGVLVHYAAFNNHIGFYALPSGTTRLWQN